MKTLKSSTLPEGIIIQSEFLDLPPDKSALCKRGADIPSTPTRFFGPLIAEAEKKGKKLFRADIGMPYEPYSPEAKEIKKQAIDEIKTAGYGPHIKDSFAQAIIAFYNQRFGLNINEKQANKLLIAGVGASEMFPFILDVVTHPGDLVLTSDPHYPNFDQPMATHGVGWVTVKTSPDSNFHPNLSLFEQALKHSQIKDRIKAIYLNSPHNPTGAVLTTDEIKEMIRLAIQYDKFIIWDGVYWNYNYSDDLDKPPASILEVIGQLSPDEQKKALEKLIYLDSMSKTFYLCDWRLGWAFIPSQDISSQIFSLIVNDANYRGNISIENQTAAAKLLTQEKDNPKILQENLQTYRTKRDLVWQKLKQLEEKNLIKLPPQPPEGGFYITFEILGDKTAEEFLTWVLTEYEGEEICTFVPITAQTGSFYNDKNQGKKEVRFCFGMLKEDINPALNAFEAELIAFAKQNNLTS